MSGNISGTLLGIIGIVGFVLVVVPFIVASFLRNVEAGTIRLVSWLAGGTVIYRGPGKSKEIPLLTTGTTISSKVINVDLDITDQTADLDENGTPQPIKVRVLASAIVSVGDTDQLIKTAANRFFAKPEVDQMNTITDLLSSSGRRAINLLTHDQLFSAKGPSRALPPGTSASMLETRTTSPERTRAPRARSSGARVARSCTICPSTSNATSPWPFASNPITARASSSIALSSVAAGADSKRKSMRQSGPTSRPSNAAAARMAAPARHGSPSGIATRPPAPKPTSNANNTRGERSDMIHPAPCSLA